MIDHPSQDTEKRAKRNPWSKLHRPGKAWYLQYWAWIAAAILVLGALGQATSSDEESAADPEPSSTTEASSVPEASTETTPPIESIEPEGTEMTSATDEEVISAFRAFIDDRSSDGVLLASAVSEITFQDGVVTAVFDPYGQGLNETQWDVASSLYENTAEFAGVPVAFANDEGKQLRTRVTQVNTVFVDGTSLGNLSAAELYEMGTGELYEEGN